MEKEKSTKNAKSSLPSKTNERYLKFVEGTNKNVPSFRKVHAHNIELADTLTS